MERRQLSKGQSVTFDLGDEPVVGSIKSIKGTKALIHVEWGIEQLTPGRKVQFANVKSKRKGRASAETAEDKVRDMTPRLNADLRAPHETLYNHLENYGVFISPTMQYQGNRHNIQATISYFQVDQRTESDLFKIKVKGDITYYGVVGMFRVPRYSFSLGLKISNISRNLKRESSLSTSTRTKTESSTKGPIISFPVNESTIIGAFFGMNETTEKAGDAEKRSVSYNRLDLGIIKKWGDDEYGLLYTPPIDIVENGVEVLIPLTILLHYDVKTAPDTRMNGFLAHDQVQLIVDSGINRWRAVWGMEFGPDPQEHMGFHLKYSSRYFRHHPDKTPGSITHWGLSFSQKLKLNDDASAGYTIEYDYADDKIKVKDRSDTKLTASNVGVGLMYRHDF